MSFVLSTRRRKLLFAAVAIAAGGYASYRVYHSSAFVRRRKQLLKYLNVISFLGEAASEGAESLSILLKDVKVFLSSDEDTIPRSLRQAFKIGRCQEFQDSVTVLSAALLRGLYRGVSVKPRKDGNDGHHVKREGFKSSNVKDDGDFGCEDVPWREIREVYLTPENGDVTTFRDWPESDKQQRDLRSYDTNLYPETEFVIDDMQRGHKDKKASGELPERLLSKLFSDAGAGFASAVAGAVARNFVLAFFDAMPDHSRSNSNFASKHQLGASSSSSSRDQVGSVNMADHNLDAYLKFISVMNTAPCKALIADCIQTFVSTAVTIYIDKTKDVNFYNDMVAGITNPSHKDPMKDVMTSVCNGAIETFVRTSYDVVFEDKNTKRGLKHVHNQSARKQFEIEECAPEPPTQAHLISSLMGNQKEDIGSLEVTTFVNEGFDGSINQNMGGTQSFIEGISKTLAIPSNRKLVVDVAGKMTSEAVRSFVNVVVSTAGSHFQSRAQGGWETVKRSVSGHRGLQLQERSQDLAIKTFVLASICLAICLHIFTGLKLAGTA